MMMMMIWGAGLQEVLGPETCALEAAGCTPPSASICLPLRPNTWLYLAWQLPPAFDGMSLLGYEVGLHVFAYTPRWCPGVFRIGLRWAGCSLLSGVHCCPLVSIIWFADKMTG
eukprot:925295-Amphidinium_carterae.1